jgi:hypothetical protein
VLVGCAVQSWAFYTGLKPDFELCSRGVRSDLSGRSNSEITIDVTFCVITALVGDLGALKPHFKLI